MSYQTFHGVGGAPFSPNKDRGLWANPYDFALACLNNAMRVDNIYGIGIVPMLVKEGFFYVLVLFFNGLLYAVPIFLIQSFLGQFSSSGYISALRVSPLFKGLGLVALSLNIISLAFHGVLIAIPMMYFLHSLQPTMPWSCDAPHPWDRQLHLTIPTNDTYYDVEIFKSHCNLNYSSTEDEYVELSVPSVEFFRDQLSDFNIDIFACVLLVWAAVAYASFQCLDKIGVYFRKCTIVVLSLLVVLFIRMLFLPDITKHMALSLPYYGPRSWKVLIMMPAITTFMTFGPGCGSVLTLASYNKFKTDIVKFSWQIPLCQLVILILLGMVSFCAEMHLIKNQSIIQPLFEHQWMSFMTIPSTLATMDYAHFWTWMFLIMIILGAFNLTLIQMLSVQTALLDEFELLRPFRKQLIFGSAAGLGFISAFFCTPVGLSVIEMVVDMTQFSQCALNLILILVVLWVYGRDRFQRDLGFMTGQVLSNWIYHYMRLVAPILLGVLLFVVFGNHVSYYLHMKHADVVVCFIVAYLPWVALPTYCVRALRQATGDWKGRLSRCIKTTDWYPVDPEEKQRYDEAFGSKEATQALATNEV